MMKLLLSTLFLLPTTTLAYRAEGFPCRAHFQCESNFCNAKLVCEPRKANAAMCLIHEACQSNRCSGGVCQIQHPAGEGPCDIHDDCSESYCNSSGTCDPLKAKQDSCGNDFECNSGRCFANPPRCTFVIYEGAICGKNADCYGDRCKMKEEGGDNRCYPRKWNNEKCNHNGDCLSLRCETQNCTEPVWLEEPCDEPSDCYSLFCNKDKGCVETAAKADNAEIEPESPGITGSSAQSSVNGGGSVDISTGDQFEAGGSPSGGGSAGTRTEMGRVAIALVVGFVGAAVAVMV